MMLQKISFAALALTLGMQQGVFAQSCNLAGAPMSELRDPLINGATSTSPLGRAPNGQPPAIGDGASPIGTNPGMPGPGTLLPWVPAIPANDIDHGFSGISLGMTPAVETPPGILGPLLTPIIPHSPSTPGRDPGNLLPAPDGFINPAANEAINPDGGIPGTGGFCTTIPTERRGGQETTQWELRGRNSVLGGLGGDGSQDEVTRLGPVAGFGVPFGVPTGNGLRNSSIDLGGGQRFKAGGSKISTGSSVQDYGLSGMRFNPLAPLRARQSYEFGQGMRKIPMYSSKTTDFGLPYSQFSPGNESPQKRAQQLLPKAVITNF
jgi:hypothetical protein